MENTNCLEGFRCPRCGSLEPFRIEITTTATVWDEGSGDTEDHEWDGSIYCECVCCPYHGKVADFSTEAGS